MFYCSIKLCKNYWISTENVEYHFKGDVDV